MKRLVTILAAGVLAITLTVQADPEQTSSMVPAEWAEGVGGLDEHEEGEPRFECTMESTLDQLSGGDRPTNTCRHGRFERTDDGHGFVHGFSGMPYGENGWSGVLQSWLLWRGENRGFQCTFDEGEIVADSCVALGGIFPYVGEVFLQECRAYDPYGYQVEIALTEFGCMVRGDVATA